MAPRPRKDPTARFDGTNPILNGSPLFRVGAGLRNDADWRVMRRGTVSRCSPAGHTVARADQRFRGGHPDMIEGIGNVHSLVANWLPKTNP